MFVCLPTRFIRRRISLLTGVLTGFLTVGLVPSTLHAQATAAAISLGSVNVGASATGTVTFTYSGTSTVSSVSVVTQGATGLDFAPNGASTCVQSSPTSGTTCTVPVKFTPLYPGGCLGAVLLIGTSGTAVATGYISGTGKGPLPVFSNGQLATTFATNLGVVRGVAIDGAGNVYANETGNANIDKFSPTGVETVLSSTVTGTGGTVDGAGNYYFGSGSGVYELVGGVAGTPVQIASGFGVDNALAVDGAGNLYLSTYGSPTGTIDEILAGGPTTRTVKTLLTTSTRFIGYTADVAGNLFLGDFNNNILYELPAGATALTTLASGPPLANPHGVALDAAGNIYVTNNGGGTVLRYAAGTYAVTTTTNAGAKGIATGPDGTLYVIPADSTVVSYTRTTVSAATSSTQGYTSPVQSVPVVNAGNASAPAGTGTAAAPFAFTQPGTSCLGTATAAGGTCTLDFTFSPTTSGNPQPGNLTDATTNGTTLTIAATGNVSGAATKVAFYTPPATPIVAGGNPGTVQAVLEDASSYYVTTPGVSVSLSSNYAGTTTYPAATTASNGGLATFNTSAPVLTVSGTYTYTAASTGLTSATANEVVTAGLTTQLKATAATTAYVGYPLTVTVQAYDQYGNQSTSTDTVSLATTPSTSTLPANFPLVSGTGSGNVTFNATGTYTVTAQDVTKPAPAVTSGTTATITVLNVPAYTVTTAIDDATGVPANCPDQANGGGASTVCSLRDALAAVTALGNANTATYVPTINFSPSLYGQTLTMLAAQTVNGNVSLVGPGAGANAITLSGNNAVTFLNNTAASAVTNFSGLTFANFTGTQSTVLIGNGAMTFTNDNFTGNNYTTTTNNGGVMGINGAITFTGCTFTGNTVALSGGAVASTPTTMTISNSLFSGNTAGTSGGAVAIYGTGALIVTNTAFLNNKASAGFGGAIYFNAAGTLTLANGTFSGNTATGQGGALNTTGLYTISNSSFSGNSITGTGTVYGGAIYGTNTGANSIRGTNFIGNFASTGAATADGGALYVDHVALTNVLFSGNYLKSASSSFGGAAYMTGPYTNTWTDVTLTGNCTAPPSTATPAVPCAGTGATTQYGGAVYQTGASVNNLYNVTVTANSAKIGGGWYKVSGSLNVYNSVISGNTASTSYSDIYTGVNTNVSSYVSTGTSATCSVNCVALLSALGSYGGSPVGAVVNGVDYTTPVQTRLPLPGSPLLRAGNATNVNGATTDARGYARTQTINTATCVGSTTKCVDIGATEANYSLAFLAQPANTLVGQTITGTTSVGTASAAPSVQLYESNQPFAAAGATTTIAASAGTLAGTTTQTFNATGLAVFSGLSITPAEANDTLLSTICVGTCAGTKQNLVVTSNPFNVTGQSGPYIAFTQRPAASLPSGTGQLSFVVQEYNADGSTHSSNDAAFFSTTLNGNYFSSGTYQAYGNGSSTGIVYPSGDGTYVTTVTDSSFTTQTITSTTVVGAGALGALQVTGFPSPDHNGTAHNVTVRAADGNGNTYTGYSGTVAFTSNDPLATLPASYTFTAADAGVHVFSVTLATGGTRTITATDTASTIAGSETGIVVDDFIWLINSTGSATKLDETGALVTSASFSGSTVNTGGVAFGPTGSAWIVTPAGNSLIVTGRANNGFFSYTGGGLTSPTAVAIDGAGYVWVANLGNSSLTEFNPAGAGTFLSGTSGLASSTLNAPSAIAIDATGGVWTANKTGNAVVHTFGAATPVVTPAGAAVANATLGVTP